MKDEVAARINEKNAARMAAFNTEMDRRNALWGGVCPDCAADVVETNPILCIFICQNRFRCVGCGKKHKIVLGEPV